MNGHRGEAWQALHASWAALTSGNHECLRSETLSHALHTTKCFKAKGKVEARLHLLIGTTQTRADRGGQETQAAGEATSHGSAGREGVHHPPPAQPGLLPGASSDHQ